jgi:hypothetical protein
MKLEILRDLPPWEWPESAGETLLKTLRNRGGNQEERLLAAELGGDLTVMNDDLAGELLRIVGANDEPEPLRAIAAIALGPVLDQTHVDGFDDPIVEDLVPPITEGMFNQIRRRLRAVYQDTSVPKLVRRRILEGSVRAPQSWHKAAIREAYASTDEEWRLTAVFGMNFVRGFDKEILEALNSENNDIHFQAVNAAGTWELEEAWEHVVELVESPATDKWLLIAAIGAVGCIRPKQVRDVLQHLEDSEDEDIAEAVEEAILMAGEDDPGDEEEEDGLGWVH